MRPTLYEFAGGEPAFRALAAAHHVRCLRRRFVDCFVLAADDAELPQDAEFRAALRDYMQWAVEEVLAYPTKDAEVPVALAMPHWSWDGLQVSGGH